MRQRNMLAWKVEKPVMAKAENTTAKNHCPYKHASDPARVTKDTKFTINNLNRCTQKASLK